MEFSFDAKFPESYINDVSLRMELYYRLGEAASLPDVDDLLEEIKDRFGEPPESVLWMYHLARIRVFAQEHRFTLLKFGQFTFTLQKKVGSKEQSHTLPLPKDIKTPEKTRVNSNRSSKNSYWLKEGHFDKIISYVRRANTPVFPKHPKCC